MSKEGEPPLSGPGPESQGPLREQEPLGTGVEREQLHPPQEEVRPIVAPSAASFQLPQACPGARYVVRQAEVIWINPFPPNDDDTAPAVRYTHNPELLKDRWYVRSERLRHEFSCKDDSSDFRTEPARFPEWLESVLQVLQARCADDDDIVRPTGQFAVKKYLAMIEDYHADPHALLHLWQ